jgi:hypothetical protein
MLAQVSIQLVLSIPCRRSGGAQFRCQLKDLGNILDTRGFGRLEFALGGVTSDQES